MRVGVRVLLVGLLVGLAGPLLAQSIERTMTPVSTEAEAADLKVLQAELLDPKRRIDTLMGVVAQISDGTCPENCMMRVPTTDMNPGNLQPWTLDSGWECVWPSEAVNRTMACPAGWNGGNYTENQRYEIRSCGSALVMVSRTLVGTSPCTREVNGLTRSNCGSNTEYEIITQVLPQPWDQANILNQSSRWVVQDDVGSWCECSRIRNSWEIVGGCKQSLGNNALNQRKKCPWGNVRRCS
jgi:hypothetical protein